MYSFPDEDTNSSPGVLCSVSVVLQYCWSPGGTLLWQRELL